jgi:divalent metal cation (Fe/Co/Zn/Cd) transporter
MLNPKCFIVGGMILSSSLQVIAFTPTNNTAACVAVTALATNTAVLQANANKERERDKDKELDMVTTVLVFIALLFLSALLFMCLFGLAGFFLGKDNDI